MAKVCYLLKAILVDDVYWVLLGFIQLGTVVVVLVLHRAVRLTFVPQVIDQ